MTNMDMNDVKAWAGRQGDKNPAPSPPGEGSDDTADAEGGAAGGVYDTIRAHADALIENTDLIAKDAEADGGLHDETAKRLVACLDTLKEAAEELKSIADDEEKLDAEDDGEDEEEGAEPEAEAEGETEETAAE